MIVPYIHKYANKHEIVQIVSNFFSISFQTIESRSPDFTNLINLKFEGPLFQTTGFIETKTH